MSARDLDEVAACLRGARQTISDLQTCLIAFGDRRWLDALERDHQRAAQMLAWIDQVLPSLPEAKPLTPEETKKVQRVIGAALDKRFGDGSEAAVKAAVDDWLGTR